MTWTGNTEAIPDLASAIVEFHLKLPGWWFSAGECSLSCHASWDDASRARQVFFELVRRGAIEAPVVKGREAA